MEGGDSVYGGTANVHICSFESCPKVTRRTKYHDWREEVLKAGRFSVFEATASALSAGMFDRLCKDPEIETESIGFPWTRVRRKVK